MPKPRRPRAVAKSLDALPKWYRLSNYILAESFTLEQWFNALWIRQTVWQLFRHHATADAYATYWNEIQKSGAAAFTTKNGLAAHVGTDAVRSLTVLDLFEIRDSIAAERVYSKHYKKFNRDLDKSTVGGPGVSAHEKLEETVRDALDPNSYWMHNAAFVVIDLNATNETLSRRFESWLQRIRNEEKDGFRTRRYSAKDCKAWFDSGLLPFLDLSHWARTQRLRIPDWLMGEAIFPPSRTINVSEAVRKSTKRLAERVLSDAFVQALAADINAANERSVARKPETQ